MPFDRGVVAVNGALGLFPQSRFLDEPGDGPLEGEVFGHQAELQHDFSDQWSALVGFTYRDAIRARDRASGKAGLRPPFLFAGFRCFTGQAQHL